MNQNSYSSDILQEFISNILRANMVDENQVESVSEILIWSNLIGRDNHGILRLPILIKRLKKGLINNNCNPEFKKTASATELLNGDNGFGHHVAQLGMKRAIKLAKNNGVGVVGVYNSNFSGAGAYFINQAAQSNMIGIALSNSFPKVTASKGIKAVLGTNPFAFGAPKRNGQNILFDMATSAGTGSMIREYLRKGKPLPENIALDSQGLPTTDPQNVEQGALLPFGDAKGYGLSIMVEMLCGVITGAGISHDVKSMYQNFSESGNNGHFLFALDLTKWITMDSYYDRLDYMVNILKSSGRDDDVLMPGEKRWSNYEYNLKNGIKITDSTRAILSEIADEHEVEFPEANSTG